MNKYSSTGSSLGTIAIGFRFCKLAVDPTNKDLYVVPYNGGPIVKYTAASNYTTKMEFPNSYGNAGIAVDGSEHVLYVGDGSTSVKAYDTTSGNLVETIELGGNGGQGIAVDEGTDTLWVTVGGGSTGVIKEFLGVETPKATTGEPTANTEVSGTADPNGQGPITECYFEYGETPAYGSTKNCAESLPITSMEEVHAVLPGLLGGEDVPLPTGREQRGTVHHRQGRG